MSELILTDYREDKDNIIIRHTQNVTDILQHNYECRKDSDEIWNTGKDMKQVASIPLAVYLELQRNGISQDQTLFRNWIESNPEYKVVNKRVGRAIKHF